MAPSLSTLHKLSLLFVLYLVQGLPFGFQVKTLPLYLRVHDVSLTSISFVGALSLPWMLKLLWAPFADTYYWPTVGRRRSWIIPATAILATSAVMAAMWSHILSVVLVAVFVMNLAGSVQDVAVDGLAIDILQTDLRGWGNAMQVVGYKVGMLLAGGVLVHVATWGQDTADTAHADATSWSTVFWGMALCAALSLAMIVQFSERPLTTRRSEAPGEVDVSKTGSGASKGTNQRSPAEADWVTAARAALRVILSPATRSWIAFLLLYKLGEVMADVMFKPFLVDAGFSTAEISGWTAGVGMIMSIAGSLLGGWVCQKMSTSTALFWALVGRQACQCGRWYLALSGATTPGLVIAVIAAEALTGGLLTTAVFTLMMNKVSAEAASTEYTAFMACEMLGKSVASLIAGALADAFGYPIFFTLTTLARKQQQQLRETDSLPKLKRMFQEWVNEQDVDGEEEGPSRTYVNEPVKITARKEARRAARQAKRSKRQPVAAAQASQQPASKRSKDEARQATQAPASTAGAAKRRRQRKARAEKRAAQAQAQTELDQGTTGNTNFDRLLQEQDLVAGNATLGGVADDEDERTIREMEKKLGLKKTKDKRGGRAILGEDLDFILNYKDDAPQVKNRDVPHDMSEDDEDVGGTAATNKALASLDALEELSDLGSEDEEEDDDDDLDAEMDGFEVDFGEDGSEDLTDEYDEESDAEADDWDTSAFDDLDQSLSQTPRDEAQSEDEMSQRASDDDDGEAGNQANPVQSEPTKGVAYISRRDAYGDNLVGDAAAQVKAAERATAQARAQAENAGLNASATPKSKYVPPALRKAMGLNDPVAKLIKGQLNRLNDSNLARIVAELETIFRGNSRNKVSEIITEFVYDACIGADKMLGHLLQVYAAAVSCLHALVGIEVSAYFLQTLVTRLMTLRREQVAKLTAAAATAGPDTEPMVLDKRCTNVCRVIALLYQFRVVSSDFMAELVDYFTQELSALDVELILETLQTCGVKLRKDDPTGLKAMLANVKAKAAASSFSSSRVRFMLEGVEDLRSNRSRLVKDTAEQLAPLVRAVRATLKGRETSVTPLRVPLRDLLDADTRGRWWLVGAAWAGAQPRAGASAPATAARNSEGPDNSASVGEAKLRKLAVSQRMNTDVRRQIFSTIMTCEDYIDAAEKLLRIKLEGKQERELIRVLLDCAVQERVHNPFYALTLCKLCEYGHQHKITLQYAFWDRFKQLQDLSVRQTTNLMRTLVHCIRAGALTLAVLKVIDLTSIAANEVFPYQLLVVHLLTSTPDDRLDELFYRLGENNSATALRDSILLFIRHYCRDFTDGVLNASASDQEKADLLARKIKIAKRALARGASAF